MATSDVITEKVYCTGQPSTDSTMAAMLNGGGYNQWMNNPFAYIMMMWLFRLWGNNGFGDGANSAENYNSRQIAALQDTVNTNHNNDLVMQAMANNQSAIRELAQTFNTDINTIQQGISGVKSAVEQVGGAVGMSAERVINAANLGDLNIVQQLKDCCCNTQKAILTQGYENQLANERQTGILGSKIDNFQSANQLGQFQMQSALGNQINDARNAMVNGFAQVGYAASQNTAQIIQSQQQQTQRILDQMCANNTQELRDKLAQLSQDAQTAQIIAGLKNSGCGCN